MNVIIFDASSTNPISQVLAVAPGDCLVINAWGLGAGETAQVYRALVALGNIPDQQSGSCLPPPQVTGAAIQNEQPYFPCNMPVQVGSDDDVEMTTVVIQQPGFYRVHLTPSALGTAVVEAQTLTGREACENAARQCCCLPETFWSGSSANACLTITPGGTAGHSPVFNIDACCLLHAFPALVAPAPTDELVVLSGGACFRATIQSVFDSALVCPVLQSFLLQAPAVGDQIIVVNAGSCLRRDAETLVEFFETPWTGVSTTAALTITPGGINGHGPTFTYDLCADIQALPSCTCEPAVGDQFVIIQGGNCTLATWPDLDLCNAIGDLPVGAIVAGDTVVVRDSGGNCKVVDATGFGFDGGAIAAPILGPSASCAAPTYSFTASPSSGMFYTGTAVRIGDDNCDEFIEIGENIVIDTQTGATGIFLQAGANISLTSVQGLWSASTLVLVGNTSSRLESTGVGSTVTLRGVGSVIIETSAGPTQRLTFTNSGEWNIGGSVGTSGQVITSNGAGVPPTWQSLGASPILAASGSCAAPSYSFTASPSSGMWWDPTLGGGAGGVVLSNANCTNRIDVGASIALRTATVTRLTITDTGEWNVGGSVGTAGQAFVSNGAGTPPTWQAVSGTVVEPSTQVVYGTGVAVDSSSFFLYDVSNGRFNVNINTGSTVLATAGNQQSVRIYGSESTNGGTGGDVLIHAANSSDASNAGRQVHISGGNASVLDRQGGSVTLVGGTATGASGNAAGGNIFISGGNPGLTGQRPGSIEIRMGQMTGADIQGNQAYIELGRANGMGMRMPSKSTEPTTLQGHDGYLAGERGQDVWIIGGLGFPAGNTDGGDIRLITGQAQNAGVGGRIDFYADKGAFNSDMAHMTSFGDIVLAGYGSGTNGTQNNTIPANATSGFLWPPRIAAAPVGVPAGTDIPGGTAYANPLTIEQAAGSTTLWLYNFAAAAWHKVTMNASGASAAVALNEVTNANGSVTRAHGANAINWGWSGLGAFAAGLTLTESASSSNAILLNLINNDTVNSPECFRAEWRASGLFSVGGGNNDRWTASGGANGNNITISAGSNSAGNGGALVLNGGVSSGNTGGGVNLTVGSGIQGGNFLGIAGTSIGSATKGGDFQIFGGPNTHVAGQKGGNPVLRGGTAAFNPTLQQGNIFLNADLTSNIATTATSGFVYLPKTAGGSPAGTPSELPATGLPMIFNVSGATVVMHVYDGTAWRSVVLT